VQEKKANKSGATAGLGQAQFQVNIIKALQAVSESANPGGDSTALSTHALTLPAGGSPFKETEVLVDTGSVYNIGTMAEGVEAVAHVGAG
jgi:hypothetical protein